MEKGHTNKQTKAKKKSKKRHGELCCMGYMLLMVVPVINRTFEIRKPIRSLYFAITSSASSWLYG